MSLHFNAVQACPSHARRKTHLALGEVCLRCEPDFEWAAGCPVCLDRVRAVGTLIQPHALTGGGVDVPCLGAGEVVYPPQKSAWRWPTRVVRARSVAVLRVPA